MELNTEPRSYVVYTGIKGKYNYENMLHEEYRHLDKFIQEDNFKKIKKIRKIKMEFVVR